MRKIIALLLILFLVGCTQTETQPNATEVTPAEPADTVDTGGAADVEPEPAPEPEPADTDTAPTNITEPEPAETTGIHTIEIQKGKFDPAKLTIAVGDTVIWKNVREPDDRFSDARIIGTQGVCRKVDSESAFPNTKGFYGPGEEFSYTFEEAGSCVFVDGMIVDMVGRITVE